MHATSYKWRGQRLRGLAELSAGMNREPMGLEPPWSVSDAFLPAGLGQSLALLDALENPNIGNGQGPSTK